MKSKPIKFVFDLDDTLYKEVDYSMSCLHFMGAYIQELYGIEGVKEHLLQWFQQGETDAIGRCWTENNLPANEKDTAVAKMQAHTPDIQLEPPALDLLDALRSKKLGYCIVTDGRSITQRAKLEALGLLDVDYISISEETAATKPSLDCFLPIQRLFPECRFLYCADNVRKDFSGPNKLGWQTIMLADDGRNIHPPIKKSSPPDAPDRVIKSLTELKNLL